MGSEMCIRDRGERNKAQVEDQFRKGSAALLSFLSHLFFHARLLICAAFSFFLFHLRAFILSPLPLPPLFVYFFLSFILSLSTSLSLLTNLVYSPVFIPVNDLRQGMVKNYVLCKACFCSEDS